MTDPRSRRWFQLSLKSLFLLMLLVATFFAGYSLAIRQADAERRRAEREAELKAAAALKRTNDWVGAGGPWQQGGGAPATLFGNDDVGKTAP